MECTQRDNVIKELMLSKYMDSPCGGDATSGS